MPVQFHLPKISPRTVQFVSNLVENRRFTRIDGEARRYGARLDPAREHLCEDRPFVRRKAHQHLRNEFERHNDRIVEIGIVGASSGASGN